MDEDLDMPAIAQIKEAILDKIKHRKHEHGSFVTLMAGKNYGEAALHADRTNLAFFGYLVRWREFVKDD